MDALDKAIDRLLDIETEPYEVERRLKAKGRIRLTIPTRSYDDTRSSLAPSPVTDPSSELVGRVFETDKTGSKRTLRRRWAWAASWEREPASPPGNTHDRGRIAGRSDDERLCSVWWKSQLGSMELPCAAVVHARGSSQLSAGDERCPGMRCLKIMFRYGPSESESQRRSNSQP